MGNQNQPIDPTARHPETVQEPASSSRSSLPGSSNSSMSPLGYFNVLLVGIYLGILFSKSEVARWQRVHDMFLFREAYMYFIISVAIVVAMISMLVIRTFRIKTIEGQPIVYQPKPFQKGIIFGGMLFGAGWAITGACPGPIYAQIGGGAWMAWFTLVGAFIGMLSYAFLKPKLPH